ncbi:hypothetical protein AGMMS50225_27500 [Betaproteobacteria bacterium]|nr:hypothetical protein AGMMS50225_27500 [Betaproteobacteria bacterium]
MKAFRALSVCVFLSMYAVNVIAANNYVPISLPHGVRMELPRNWEVFSLNLRIMLDSSVQAKTESIGMFDASSDLNFAANFYDDSGKTAALVNVRYYPNMARVQPIAAYPPPCGSGAS